jgi:hypothetical protein
MRWRSCITHWGLNDLAPCVVPAYDLLWAAVSACQACAIDWPTTASQGQMGSQGKDLRQAKAAQEHPTALPAMGFGMKEQITHQLQALEQQMAAVHQRLAQISDVRNDAIEEVAIAIEQLKAFGPDTVSSLAIYIRELKDD